MLNRGIGRRKLFNKDADFEAYLELLAAATSRVPMRILGFCLMSNHWHLVLWPHKNGDLSAFMRWLSNTHVRRHHQHYQSYGEGHIYQGRFKHFPVQDDGHLLTLLRYVEANPLRAKLVLRAQDWRWSSLSCQRSPRTKIELLTDWPVDRPRRWTALVNEPLEKGQQEAVQTSLRRGRPLGGVAWSKATARRLGLGFTLNPHGRPRKAK
ncbi:MAG: transposase [Acidobacteriota bacterium]